MNEQERARLTEVFKTLLKLHRGKPRLGRARLNLAAITAAYDAKHKADPWVRLAMESRRQ